jgi:hypothetical protein
MTDEQKAAFINAQAAAALIEAIGMHSDNMQYPEAQPHDRESFQKLILEYGIHHNAIVGLFHG